LATEHDLDPRNIAQVTVHTNPMTIQVTGDNSPPSIYKAKFSMAFVVGVALAYRQAGLEEFSPQRLHDPIVQGLVEKTRLVADPEYTGTFPKKWSARIEVKTRDGRFYSAETDFPKGDSDNPISDEEIRAKFSQMVSPLLPPEQVSYLITATDQLQDLSDVSEFLPSHSAIQVDQLQQMGP
jgi:2-methylcitrate dehydratase PrpD